MIRFAARHPVDGRRPQTTVMRPGSPQARGLIGWWPWIGAPGQHAYDFGGNLGFADGTVVGDTAAHVTDADPIFGRVVRPGNRGEWRYESPISDMLLGATHVSMTMWIKLDVATLGVIVGTGCPMVWDGESAILQSVYVATDGNIKTSCFRTTRSTFAPSAKVDRTKWHLIACTAKPGTGGWKFWQNTEQVGSEDFTSVPAILRTSVGGNGNGSVYFNNGVFCDCRLYNRCLEFEDLAEMVNPATRWDLYYVPGPPLFEYTSLRQTNYRWREDDGTEQSATNAAAVNTQLVRGKELPARLRLQLAAMDAQNNKFSLQYRVKGSSDPWRTVQP